MQSTVNRQLSSSITMRMPTRVRMPASRSTRPSVTSFSTSRMLPVMRCTRSPVRCRPCQSRERCWRWSKSRSRSRLDSLDPTRAAISTWM